MEKPATKALSFFGVNSSRTSTDIRDEPLGFLNARDDGPLFLRRSIVADIEKSPWFVADVDRHPRRITSKKRELFRRLLCHVLMYFYNVIGFLFSSRISVDIRDELH